MAACASAEPVVMLLYALRQSGTSSGHHHSFRSFAVVHEERIRQAFRPWLVRDPTASSRVKEPQPSRNAQSDDRCDSWQ